MFYKFFNRDEVKNTGVFYDISRRLFPFIPIQFNSLLPIVKPTVIRREVPVAGFFY